jgi:hypothetical protein
MQHVTIYREPGRYAGWPANYGIWSWGDEIVVGFTLGYADEKGGFHARDRSRPFVAMQARSLDGGEHWQVEQTPCRTPGNRGILSADEHVDANLSAAQAIEQQLEHCPAACPGGIDFSHPDFALMCARTGLGGGTVSWFYTSVDRCRSWDGPFALPMFEQPGIDARTDALVTGSSECLLFLTAAREDGSEGKGVFCARTVNGGATFEFVSWLAMAESGYVIMPSSVRLSETRILSAVRCREGGSKFEEARCWIDLYRSDDNGTTWTHLGQPVPNTGRGGNPPMLIRLHDGQLCLTYGFRNVPFGMRAKLSKDGGITWGPEIILTEDAGSHDLGYPRSAQRADGAVVTVYYTNDRPGGEGYLAATIWMP